MICFERDNILFGFIHGQSWEYMYQVSAIQKSIKFLTANTKPFLALFCPSFQNHNTIADGFVAKPVLHATATHAPA